MAARKKPGKPKGGAGKPAKAKPAADDLDELPDLPDDVEDLPEIEPMGDGGDLDELPDLDVADAAVAAAAALVPDPLQTLPVDVDVLPALEELPGDSVQTSIDIDELPALPGEHDTVLEIGGAPTEAVPVLEAEPPAAPAPPSREPPPPPAGPPDKTLPSDSPDELAVLPPEPAAADDRLVRARGSQAVVASRCAVLEEQLGSQLLEGTDAVAMPPGCDDLIERGRKLLGPHAEGRERAAQARTAAADAAQALDAARARVAELTARRQAAVAQSTGVGEMLADHLLSVHAAQIAALAAKKLPDPLVAAVQAVGRVAAIDAELDQLDAAGAAKKKPKLKGERETALRTARQVLVGIGTGSFPLVDALAKGCAACASSRATLAEAADRVRAAGAELAPIDVPALAAAAAAATRAASEVDRRERENDAAWHELAPRVGRLWLQHRREQGVAPSTEEERIWRDLDRQRGQLDGYVDALVLHLKAAQAEVAARQAERLEQAVTGAREALEQLQKLRAEAEAAASAAVEALDRRRSEAEASATRAVAAVAQAADRARQDGETALQAILQHFNAARRDADTAHRQALTDAEEQARAAAARVGEARDAIDRRVGELATVTTRLDALDDRLVATGARLDGLAERLPDAEGLDRRVREAGARVDELATKVEWASTEARTAAQQVADAGAKVGDLAARVDEPIAQARAAAEAAIAAFERDIEASREALASSEQKTRQKRAQQTEELLAELRAKGEQMLAGLAASLKSGSGRVARSAPAADDEPEPDIELEPIDDEPPARERDRGRDRDVRGRRRR